MNHQGDRKTVEVSFWTFYLGVRVKVEGIEAWEYSSGQVEVKDRQDVIDQLQGKKKESVLV